jgi:hypothetical protein
MAKLLNLKLNYKGKPLDFVRHGRDFKNKFFIGKDKYLFWQILDDNFPEKHLFISEKGNQLFMELTPGAKLSCNKDGNPVDSSYLTQNNILKGTELQLRPDMTGTVAIAPNWEISYEFKEPWVTVLTPEEKQIAAQYARYSEPSAMERFNRNLVLLFVFLTIVFILIFDLTLKQRFNYDDTLEQKLATLQKAELVRAEAFEQPAVVENTTSTGTTTAPEATKEEAPTGAVATTGTGTGTSKAASALFGLGNFDPNATSSAPTIKAVTTAEGFVAARPGRGGGGGGGSGPGGSGPGSGTGYTTSFDPNAGRSFGSDIGEVATNAPRLAGSNVRPDVGTIVKASGDQSKLAPSGVVFGQTATATKLASSFKSKNISQVSESSIAAAPAADRNRYETIGATVQARRSQVNAIYTTWNARTPFSGSATIRLLIGANGKVQSALITPNGDMPAAFLQEIKSLCESWSFNISQESDYTFTARFRKG